MKIRPADNWHWYFDKDHDRVILDLANGIIFRSRYPAKMLTPDAFKDMPFCVDDAALYFHFYESCQQLDVSDDFCAELTLNALVAIHYLKPLMPRSWYFTQQPIFKQPNVGEIVTAKVIDTDEELLLLTIESNESASLCLIAQSQVNLSGKTFVLGDVIKIMNDRLKSFDIKQANIPTITAKVS